MSQARITSTGTSPIVPVFGVDFGPAKLGPAGLKRTAGALALTMRILFPGVGNLHHLHFFAPLHERRTSQRSEYYGPEIFQTARCVM